MKTKLYATIITLFLLPVLAQAQEADRNFWLLTGASFAATIVDIELSQSCINRYTCREINPIFKNRKRLGIYSISLGATGGYALMGYWLKKKELTIWYVPQLTLIGVHSFGATWALRY